MYRNILIATDGSELADRAVTHGLGLAKATGAKVTAVTVTDHFPTTSAVMMPRAGDVERYAAATASVARGILDKVESAARELGIACTIRHVVDELPAEGVLKAAKEGGCDLIVMASHGRRGVDRLLLGSQSLKVMAASGVPVLICR